MMCDVDVYLDRRPLFVGVAAAGRTANLWFMDAAHERGSVSREIRAGGRRRVFDGRRSCRDQLHKNTTALTSFAECLNRNLRGMYSAQPAQCTEIFNNLWRMSLGP